MERIRKYEPLWDKWRATRIIGEGEFGAVYEAECNEFGVPSKCAIKLITLKNKEFLQGIDLEETISAEKIKAFQEKRMQKIIKEATLMQNLQAVGDHIVTIYDYKVCKRETTTDLIIRMELLTSLKEYMKKEKINTDFVIRMGISLCKALKSCEAKKIIHRDIKPANIFVNENGTFKLGDFGLSRETTSSSLGDRAGTPLYMSPEAFDYLREVDNRTDIYSLGIVMYQMLNNQNIPFADDIGDFSKRDEAIRRRIKGEILPPPKHENGQLWKIIQKACEFKEEDRYQHAAEMQKDLEKLRYEKIGKNWGVDGKQRLDELEFSIEGQRSYVELLLSEITENSKDNILKKINLILQKLYEEDKTGFQEWLYIIKEKDKDIYTELLCTFYLEKKSEFSYSKSVFTQIIKDMSDLNRYTLSLNTDMVPQKMKDDIFEAGVDILNENIFNNENYDLFDEAALHLNKKQQWIEILEEFLKELKPYRDELDEEQKTAVYHIEKIFNKYHAKTKKGIHINIKKIKTVETSKSENKKELSEKQESLGSVAELGTGTKNIKSSIGNPTEERKFWEQDSESQEILKTNRESEKSQIEEVKQIEQDKEEIQTGLELDQLMKELSQMKEEVEELKRKKKEEYDF